MLNNITQAELYSGCLLASIAHAASVCLHPDFSYERSWDEKNYCVQDSMGTRGTISFVDVGCVAAFRDENCARSSYLNPRAYDIETFLAGMPDALRRVCEQETLLYLLDDLGDVTQPVITTSFWGQDGTLTSNDNWNDVMEYGAHSIRIECLPPDEALLQWGEENDLSDAMIEIVSNVYNRKTMDGTNLTFLTHAEHELLLSTAVTPEAIEESQTSFREVGIEFPAY